MAVLRGIARASAAPRTSALCIPTEWIDALPIYYLALTPDGRVEWMTRVMRDAFGFDVNEVVGIDFARRFVPADVRPRWTQLLDRLTRTDQPVADHLPMVTRSGRTLDAEWRFWMRRNDAGIVTRIEGIDVDATSNRDSQRWLIQGAGAEDHWIRNQIALLEYVADHIVLADAHRVILYVNRAFETVSGLAREQAVGKTIDHIWMNRIDPQHHQELLHTLADGNVYHGEFVNRNAAGELFYDEVTVSPLRAPGGEVKYLLAVGRDATAKRLSDPSTGLQARALLLERVRLAIARARRHSDASRIALLFIDVDRFKVINDTYGMGAGDQVILEISRRLNSAVRKIDAVAHVGHLNRDEFAVLVEDLSDPSDASNVAERLLEQLRRPIVIESNEIVLSVSIGIASGMPRYEQPEELLRDAETAMNLAKQSPTESCRIFDPALHERALVRAKLGIELRRAIETEEIVAFYQPIVSLTKGTITGAEALVRWRHPSRGLVPPMEFIPAAEDSGLIVPLGQRVLREACRQVATWHGDGHGHLTVAVNVSLRQFRDRGFVDAVRDVLGETQLNPSALKLELTESTAADDPDAVVRILHQLRQLGVQTLMDDFGTGYSSLSYLTRLSLDKLKIDRSFIMRIPGSSHDSLVASTIIVLAHNLGLGVIAEGVETEAQLEFLRQLGCEEIQGFLFSPPVPTADFGRLLTDGYTLELAIEKKRASLKAQK
jgi:diguanylate cyclase (GGDEF)-like protein/PAS domain S-box-containing protein